MATQPSRLRFLLDAIRHHRVAFEGEADRPIIVEGIKHAQHFIMDPLIPTAEERQRIEQFGDADTVRKLPFPHVTIEGLPPPISGLDTLSLIIYATQGTPEYRGPAGSIGTCSFFSRSPFRNWRTLPAKYPEYPEATGSINVRDLPSMEQTGFAVYMALSRLTLLLDSPGVEIEMVEPDMASNQLRRARGLSPLPPHRIVRIGDRVAYEKHLADKPARHHASPREHDRRGHWRACKSGKRVWVRHCRVGDPNLGRVDHTYVAVEEPMLA